MSEQVFALFLSGNGLPGRLGCKHFSNGDVMTCSHCQRTLTEGLKHLLHTVFTAEQLERIPAARLPKIIGALVRLILERGLKKDETKNGEQGNG